MKEKIQKIVDKFRSHQFYSMIKQIPDNILIQFSKENTIVDKYNKIYTIRRLYCDKYSLHEYLIKYKYHKFFNDSLVTITEDNKDFYFLQCLINNIRYEIKETMEYAIFQRNNKVILEIYNIILYLRNKFSFILPSKINDYERMVDSYNYSEYL